MREIDLPEAETLDLNLDDDSGAAAAAAVPISPLCFDEALGVVTYDVAVSKKLIAAAREAVAPLERAELCGRACVSRRIGLAIIEKLVASRQLAEVASGRRGMLIWAPEHVSPPMTRVDVDITAQACSAAVAAIYLRDALVKSGRGDVAAALDNAFVRRSFLNAVMLVVRADSVERFDYSLLASRVTRDAIAAEVVP